MQEEFDLALKDNSITIEQYNHLVSLLPTKTLDELESVQNQYDEYLGYNIYGEKGPPKYKWDGVVPGPFSYDIDYTNINNIDL